MVCWPIRQEILTDINAYCNNKLTFRQEVALVVFGGGLMLGAVMAGWRPRPHVAGPDLAMTGRATSASSPAIVVGGHFVPAGTRTCGVSAYGSVSMDVGAVVMGPPRPGSAQHERLLAARQLNPAATGEQYFTEVATGGAISGAQSCIDSRQSLMPRLERRCGIAI
jgi:hypothetical protein